MLENDARPHIPYLPDIPCLPEGSVVLGKILGHGGFGCVYQGTYKKAPVAVKHIMNPGLSTDDANKMVQKELKLLLRLRHSNFICQVIGYQHTNRLLSIVMTLAENGDLQKFLKAGRLANDWSTKARICLDVAKAVKLIHDESIIHNDLKAANILLDQSLTPKLTDFGISKSFYSSITGSFIGGTFRYVAPERFVNSEREFSFEELIPCDIYGYGLILWETATDGATPYKGRDEIGIQIAKMEKTDPLQYIGQLPSDVPELFGELMRQYLKWEPSHRPSLTTALCAFNAYINADPTSGTPTVEDAAAADQSELDTLINVLHHNTFPYVQIDQVLADDSTLLSVLIDWFNKGSTDVSSWLGAANIAVYALEQDVKGGLGQRDTGELDGLMHVFESNMELLTELVEVIDEREVLDEDVTAYREREGTDCPPSDVAVAALLNKQRQTVKSALTRLQSKWSGLKHFLASIKKELLDMRQRKELVETMDEILVQIDDLSTAISQFQEQRLINTTNDDSTPQQYPFPIVVSASLSSSASLIPDAAAAAANLFDGASSQQAHMNFGLHSDPSLLDTLTRDDLTLMQIDGRAEPLFRSIEQVYMRLTSSSAPADPTGAINLKHALVQDRWESLRGEIDKFKDDLKEERWLQLFQQAADLIGSMVEGLDRTVAQCHLKIAEVKNWHAEQLNVAAQHQALHSLTSQQQGNNLERLSRNLRSRQSASPVLGGGSSISRPGRRSVTPASSHGNLSILTDPAVVGTGGFTRPPVDKETIQMLTKNFEVRYRTYNPAIERLLVMLAGFIGQRTTPDVDAQQRYDTTSSRWETLKAAIEDLRARDFPETERILSEQPVSPPGSGRSDMSYISAARRPNRLLNPESEAPKGRATHSRSSSTSSLGRAKAYGLGNTSATSSRRTSTPNPGTATNLRSSSTSSLGRASKVYGLGNTSTTNSRRASTPSLGKATSSRSSRSSSTSSLGRTSKVYRLGNTSAISSRRASTPSPGRATSLRSSSTSSLRRAPKGYGLGNTRATSSRRTSTPSLGRATNLRRSSTSSLGRASKVYGLGNTNATSSRRTSTPSPGRAPNVYGLGNMSTTSSRRTSTSSLGRASNVGNTSVHSSSARTARRESLWNFGPLWKAEQEGYLEEEGRGRRRSKTLIRPKTPIRGKDSTFMNPTKSSMYRREQILPRYQDDINRGRDRSAGEPDQRDRSVGRAKDQSAGSYGKDERGKVREKSAGPYCRDERQRDVPVPRYMQATENTTRKSKTSYEPDPQDPLDVALGKVINESSIPLKCVRAPQGGGKYYFRSDLSRKLFFCKLVSYRNSSNGSMSSKVLVRVGGGWQDLDRFIFDLK